MIARKLRKQLLKVFGLGDFMVKIKKATFWEMDYSNDVVGDKSAIDKLNEYIVENQISKCDIINIEEKNDCGNYCLNLYYCESE